MFKKKGKSHRRSNVAAGSHVLNPTRFGRDILFSFAFILIPITLLSLPGSLFSQESKTITIEWDMAEGATGCEIQWLTVTDPLVDPASVIEVCPGSPIKKELPEGFPYFRIRSIKEAGKIQFPGAWSDVQETRSYLTKKKVVNLPPPVPTGDSFREVVYEKGDTRLYFIAKGFRFYSSDENGGKVRTFYEINGTGYREATGEIEFPVDGIFILTYYSEDELGNREPVRAVRFFVDRTPPDVSIEFSQKPVKKNGRLFVGSDAKVFIKSSDKDSGYSRIYYSVSSMGPAEGTGAAPEFTEITGPIDLKQLKRTGTSLQRLQFYAEDAAGNKTPIYNLFVRIPENDPGV